jgi:signal peptidase I
MSDEPIQVNPPAHSEPAFAPVTESNGSPPVSVGTATPPAPASTAPPPGKNEPVEGKDSPREIIETIVFVIVLVLLLKSFVAEAFVIPTGSMAETLWGYQKRVECPECHYVFPVNCSSEVEPPKSDRREVTECLCPNCRLHIHLKEERNPPRPETGDRVLVDKSLYDLLEEPGRFDVVVFKYPEKPQKDQVPMNYIKRLVGQPGETIAIYGGDLYRTTDLRYPHRTPPSDPEELRQAKYDNDPDAQKLFTEQLDLQFARKVENQGFEIVRKSPEKMLALRRIVNDNDFQATDLRDHPHRWSGDGGWKPDNAELPRRFEHAGAGSDFAWLTYRHILRYSDRPRLITDFMGYNAANGKPYSPDPDKIMQNWIGDLMLECTATVTQPQGRLTLDLAKGVDRFQARWDLATGICTLVRLTDGKEETLDSQPTAIKKAGTYELRFANFDERLTVWVNGKLAFGDGVVYKPAKSRGPYENDLKPARIGVQGSGLSVSHLKLWRDTYYTIGRSSPNDADAELGNWAADSPAWENPEDWGPLRNLQSKTMYVQPGHYLCMGDNSPESSDGRAWGLVPRRLLLGRALLVYYPINRAGPIR